MAKVIVEIDIPNQSYEDLKRDLIDKPDPTWFEGQDEKTGNVAIDSSYLIEDSFDDSFYVFKLISVVE